MNTTDLQHLRTAIDVAQRARDHGNHPFGAILVDENNQVLLQAENTVVTGRDCTGHAETNLMRLGTRAVLGGKAGSVDTLYKHRTLRDVCGRDPLGQCETSCVCVK